MNPRARRQRRYRRLHRQRLTHLVCTAGQPIPKTLAWNHDTDMLTWGSSCIRLDDVRRRRWREALSRQAKDQLIAFMGPNLSRELTQRQHPTWDERKTRILDWYPFIEGPGEPTQQPTVLPVLAPWAASKAKVVFNGVHPRIRRVPHSNTPAKESQA